MTSKRSRIAYRTYVIFVVIALFFSTFTNFSVGPLFLAYAQEQEEAPIDTITTPTVEDETEDGTTDVPQDEEVVDQNEESSSDSVITTEEGENNQTEEIKEVGEEATELPETDGGNVDKDEEEKEETTEDTTNELITDNSNTEEEKKEEANPELNENETIEEEGAQEEEINTLSTTFSFFSVEENNNESYEEEFSPYCGNGIVDQEWEQCDGTEGCTEQCQLEADNMCRNLVLARIVTNDVQNITDPKLPLHYSPGNMTDTVFLGSTINPIPSGAWFPLYWNGTTFVDAPMWSTSNSYENVPGYAVERGAEGRLHIVMAGTDSAFAVEHANGFVEFWNATIKKLEDDTITATTAVPLFPPGSFLNPHGQGVIYSTPISPAGAVNNGLENEWNGIEEIRAAEDELATSTPHSAHFWMTTTTGDDGFFVSWDTTGELCPLLNQCEDGLDNDDDKLSDINDPDCHTDGNPENNESYNPDNNENEQNLIISNEQVLGAEENSVTLRWTTNIPGTSIVVFGTTGTSTPGNTPPMFGYTSSTPEISDATTTHTVIITGLNADTIYFWRPVSRESTSTAEYVFGAEGIFITQTDEDDNNGGGGGGQGGTETGVTNTGGGGGGGGSPNPTTFGQVNTGGGGGVFVASIPAPTEITETIFSPGGQGGTEEGGAPLITASVLSSGEKAIETSKEVVEDATASETPDQAAGLIFLGFVFHCPWWVTALSLLVLLIASLEVHKKKKNTFVTGIFTLLALLVLFIVGSLSCLWLLALLAVITLFLMMLLVKEDEGNTPVQQAIPLPPTKKEEKNRL